MELEIITPEKNIYKGEVDAVKIPGFNGSFGVLDNHAPLVSTLKKGEIELTEKDSKEEKKFPVESGVIEVYNNKVIVLVE